MGARYRVVPREDGGWKLIADDSVDSGSIQQEVRSGQIPGDTAADGAKTDRPLMPFPGTQRGSAAD